MKIVIVGATGTIGKTVAEALQDEHEIIRVGSKSGDIQTDITSPESVEKLFKQTGNFDALISTTGNGYFGPLSSATLADFDKGIRSKLMGQVNLVLTGQHYINPGGSFTLTSGILSYDPVATATNLSLINGGLNSFVISAAIELEKGVRINAVSPGVVEDSPGYFKFFPGHVPVPMSRVVAAYIKSVLGKINGQVIEIH